MRVMHIWKAQKAPRPPNAVLPSAPEGNAVSDLKKRCLYPWAVALNNRQSRDNLFPKNAQALQKIDHLGIQ
jgi:hypothetical protein